MKSVIAGGSGFVGEALVEELLRSGEVVVLTRNSSRVTRGRGVEWDGATDGPWQSEIDDADVVVNLAGASIGGGRWTRKRKAILLRSRIDPTTALVRALRRNPSQERLFFSVSGVGYYGDRGDEILDEAAGAGDDFLADVCDRWESAAADAADAARLVIGRFGVVLGAGGGALPRLEMPVRLFVGGPIGGGEQWVSWVDRRDVVRFLRWAIDTPSVRGRYNVTSPNPVTNRELVKTIASVLHRPAIIPAPAFAIRAALGEMGSALLLVSQRAIPQRALQEEFSFEVKDLRRSLEEIRRAEDADS